MRSQSVLAILVALAAMFLIVFWLGRNRLEQFPDVAPAGENAFGGEQALSPEDGPDIDNRPANPSERQALPLLALGGRVLTKDGSPIGQATLSWTALESLDLEWEPAWHDDDWGSLERRTVWTTSATDGHYTFEERPGDPGSGSVIWATHPDFEAGCLLLDRETDPTSSLGIIYLPPSAPLVVRVEGINSESIAGAQVAQFGLTPRFSPVESDGKLNEARARRYLHRSGETQDDGRVHLSPFPGQQVIQAAKERQRSLPWRGIRRDEVVLKLLDGFTVGGHVSFPDWSHLDYVGERRITIAAQKGNVWHSLATLRSVQQGPWGPISLPVLNGHCYRISLEGSPIIPENIEFEPPPVGSHLSFDLQPELGHHVWAQATNREREPILDSEAIAWWYEDGRPHFVRRHARPDGYVDLWSFPKGTIWITLSAPGYVSDTSDPWPVPSDFTCELILNRAGLLRGFCFHEGQPIENFEVVYWKPGYDNYRVTRAFHGRPDGSFELDDVPIGDVFVTAASDAFIGGQPQVVSVPVEGAAEVTLDLLSPQTARGTVVDAVTAEGIPTAKVQAFVMGGRGPIAPWGSPLTVRSDGTFELDGLIPGTNSLQVFSPGYATKTLSLFAIPGEAVEIGHISLTRPQALEIQLTTQGPLAEAVDFTSYQVSSSIEVANTGEAPLPCTRFSTEGTVRFEGVSPGFKVVTIERADSPWITLKLELPAGQDWHFTHRVAGTRRLTIEIQQAPGYEIEDTLGLYVSYDNSEGCSVTWGVDVPASGMVQLEGIDSETVTVDLLDHSWQKIQTVHRSFEDRDDMHLTISVGEDTFLLRIVDPDGLPVAGAIVSVLDPRSPAFFANGTTGPNGICELYGIPEHELAITVFHQSQGFLDGVLLDGSAREAEIILENDAGIIIVTMDGDVPVSDVGCHLVNTHGQTSSRSRSTNANGMLEWMGLTSGSYRFGAQRPNCWPITLELEANKDPTPQVVQIRRLGDLTLELKAENGLPISGQAVDLESVEFSASVATWLADERVQAADGLTSDRKGLIHIQGLPRGTYRWSVTAATGETYSGQAEVHAGEDSTTSIVLPY